VRARVLVVDDSPDLRRLLHRLLRPHFELDEAGDGEAALERIRALRPDLVLSDAMMPRLDGFGLLRALRSDPATRELPVIMLSGRADASDRATDPRLEADDYLIKPFTTHELLARVRKHLALARTRAALAEERDRARAELDALRRRDP